MRVSWDHVEHPPHEWEIAIADLTVPIRPKFHGSWWQRIRQQRECIRRGGHWWHSYTGHHWFCCQCPKRSERTPRGFDRMNEISKIQDARRKAYDG